MARKLEELEIFDGFKVSPRVGSNTITHLQFADDTMFFLGASLEKACALKELLIWFKTVSRLQINMSKSKLDGVSEVDSLAEIANV